MKVIFLFAFLLASFVTIGQTEVNRLDIWRVYKWNGINQGPFGPEKGKAEIYINKDLSVIRYDYDFSGHPDYAELSRDKADIQVGRLFHVKGNTYLFIEYIKGKATNNSWAVSINKRRLKFLAVGSSPGDRPERRLGLRLERVKVEW
ncbi:MAG: hypothetical protein Roseis2KO_33190 [Roseivirga sp.]